MKKKYIFTKDATYSKTINGVSTVIKTFKRGDVIMAYGPFYMPNGGYTVSYPLPVGSPMPSLRISHLFIKPFKQFNKFDRNSNLKSDSIESSYFGAPKDLNENRENLKTAFVVMGIGLYVLIFYFLFIENINRGA